MKPELKEKILNYNRALAEQKRKAEDMDIIITAISKMPPGQQNKFLTDEVMAILAKYGVE